MNVLVENLVKLPLLLTAAALVFAARRMKSERYVLAV